jgi:hypothetical protein
MFTAELPSAENDAISLLKLHMAPVPGRAVYRTGRGDVAVNACFNRARCVEKAPIQLNHANGCLAGEDIRRVSLQC